VLAKELSRGSSSKTQRLSNGYDRPLNLLLQANPITKGQLFFELPFAFVKIR
jgi:hypothetical protein